MAAAVSPQALANDPLFHRDEFHRSVQQPLQEIAKRDEAIVVLQAGLELNEQVHVAVGFNGRA